MMTSSQNGSHYKSVNTTLQMFHIRVVHFKKVILVEDEKEAELEAYDGPGIKSRLFRFSSQFVSSTFQVVAKMHIESHETQTINYIAVDQNFTTRYIKKNSQHLLESCFNRICLIHLQSNRNSTIEGIIKNMQYHGDVNRASCDFAGVALYDHKSPELEYTHRRTECVLEFYARQYDAGCKYYKHRDPRKWYQVERVAPAIFKMSLKRQRHPAEEESQYFHSDGHDCLVVVYSYEEYGALSVEISTTATPASCFYMTVNSRNCYQIEEILHVTQCVHLQIARINFRKRWREKYSLKIAPHKPGITHKVSISGFLGGLFNFLVH